MSGSLYIAEVDKSETTFGPEHQRKDIVPVGFTLDHAENGFAQVALMVKNPRAGGLLAPGLPRCIWVSEEISPGVFQPLFFGRLKGWPDDWSGETVALSYDGRPADFNARQEALRQTLMTLPEVDPVMINADDLDKPDTVLIARSARWHADRVTQEVTISDIITGEDGLEVFAPSECSYVSVRPSRGATPLKSISVNATVHWKQSNSVAIDMGTKVFDTYTGDGIFGDWFKPGASIGGSYTVLSSSAVDVYQVSSALTASWSSEFQNQQKTHVNGDTLSSSLRVSKPVLLGPFLSVDLVDNITVGLNAPNDTPPVNIGASRQTNTTYVPQWKIQTSLVLGVGADRDYTERLKFTMEFNLQELDTDSEDAVTTDSIEIDGNDVGSVLPDGTTNGSIPIGSTDRSSYYLQPRGDQTIQHLLLRARARGLTSARCLTVQSDIPWPRARDLSCRKSAQIPDGRIPGGKATGKITAYQLRLNPQTGEYIGNVTIECAPGFGQALEAVPGTPEYVDEGVLDPGIQFYTASTIVAAGVSDTAYSPPTQIPNDDGLVPPFTREQIVVSETITGADLATQRAAILAAFEVEKKISMLQSKVPNSQQASIDIQNQIAVASRGNLAAVMKANPSTYRLELKDLGDGFESDFTVDVSPVEAPRGIDLQKTLASASALFVDPDSIYAPTVT